MEIPKRRRPRRRKPNTLMQLICFLSAILAVFLVIALSMGHNDPEPDGQIQATTLPTVPSSSVVPPSSSSVVTQPSTIPPETFPPVTTPPATQPGLAYIGNLYTRQELSAMDTTMVMYGTGLVMDDKNRPINALELDAQFEKYDAHFIGPDNNKIYLTYNVTYEQDDCVKKTLDVLREKNVKAVFFIDKGFVRLWPELVQQIIDDGHILANHCTTHPELPTLSIDKIVSQIMDIHNYILENFNYKMHIFRPPSGYYSEQVLAIAQSLGYRTFNWSFTYRDWELDNQPEHAVALQTMLDGLHSGAIYQLHAISPTNAAILDDFIDAARSIGYEFELLP